MSANKGKTDSEEREERGQMRQDANAVSRARNKTVMLTPEIAGKVRAQLQGSQEEFANEDIEAGSDPVSDLLPPISWDDSVEDNRQLRAPVAPERKVQEVASSHPQTASLSEREITAPPRQPLVEKKEEVLVTKEKEKERPTVKMLAENVSGVQIVSAKPSKLVGFLISYENNENGEVIELRHGRWLLTSRPSDHSEQQIIIDDESISPLHAIIRATGDGKVQVLDQLSEYGTSIKRAKSDEEIDLAGSMEIAGHGDKIRFGKREFVVCLIPVK